MSDEDEVYVPIVPVTHHDRDIIVLTRRAELAEAKLAIAVKALRTIVEGYDPVVRDRAAWMEAEGYRKDDCTVAREALAKLEEKA